MYVMAFCVMTEKEKLISELGFLDENIALDEKPKAEKKVKAKRNAEVPDMKTESALLSAIQGLSDEAALAVLSAYKKMPRNVKDAAQAVYDALGGFGADYSMEDLKERLKALKAACGAKYMGLYEIAVKDSKNYVPKIQSRLFSEGLED